MKTAISMPDDLFNDIDRLSKELRRSRSRILSDAAREYIEKMKNRKIFEALNKAYEDVETEQETKIRKRSKKHYAGLIRDDKW